MSGTHKPDCRAWSTGFLACDCGLQEHSEAGKGDCENWADSTLEAKVRNGLLRRALAAEVERDRCREALERIANQRTLAEIAKSSWDGPPSDDFEDAYDTMIALARAALSTIDNTIALALNDSARLRAELDEAIEKLRPISRYYPGDFVHNAHGSEVFTFRFTVDQWNAIRRLVARHEGRK